MVVGNISNLSTINSLYTLASFSNSASNGVLFGFLLIGIFIIITVKTLRNGVERAVAASAFACFILSLPLFYLSLVQLAYPVIFAVILAGTLMFIRFTEQ